MDATTARDGHAGPSGSVSAAGGRPVHGGRRTAPWTVYATAVVLTIQALMIAEHARRLLSHVVRAEETLGLAALAPLDREVPAAVVEAIVALSLLVAAVAIARRSRLALAWSAVVQGLMLVDVAARLGRGLALEATALLFVTVIAGGALLAAPATRRWCTTPIALS